MMLRRAPARPGTPFLLAAFLALAMLLAVAPRGGVATAQNAAADEPTIPPAVGYVNDHAGVLDDATRAKLESFLDQVEKKTGVQFAVLIVDSTAPMTPTEYKTKVFDAWKIGARGKDNGLLMLVALAEHEVRFETGYGLEGVLPDGLQSRIFRDEMAPHFRANDPAGGITAGILACASRIAADQNVQLEWNGSELRYGDGGDAPSRSRLLTIVILFVIFLIFSSVLRRVFGGIGRYGGWGGWGGGFGGFGGGFGGFGGGGGGGSFGGFGGGSSGGGGGGGKW